MAKAHFTRIGKCDVCQQWFPLTQLRRVPHDSLAPVGGNYLLYSEYNVAGWTSTYTNRGAISFGVNGNALYRVDTEGTACVMTFGAQTWSGVGILRTASAAAIDMSTWTNYCFWTELGARESELNPQLSVVVGYCDPTGVTKVPLRTFSFLGQRRVWCNGNVADLSISKAAVCFYVEVTPVIVDTYWWAQWAQISKDVVKPDQFIPTSGAAVIYTGNDVTRSLRMAVIACQKDQDSVLLRRRTPGRREVDPPVPYEEKET